MDGPTLSLSSITFNAAGTYICEAYTPTVPLLSRTRVFKLLVEGLGVGAGWDGDNGGAQRSQDQWEGATAGPLPSTLFLSPLSFSYSALFPTVPPAHALPPHHPQGHPI